MVNIDMHVFKQNNNDQIHYSFKKGKWNDNEAMLTRITSSMSDQC